MVDLQKKRGRPLKIKPLTTPRQCLCCGKPFASEGPHNRLCTPCRSKSIGPYDLN